MKNRNVQILDFGFRWPFTVEFFAVTVRDSGNPSTYYQKLAVQSMQRKKKPTNNWMKNKYSEYLPNMLIFFFFHHLDLFYVYNGNNYIKMLCIFRKVILPILFLYLNTVIVTAGAFEP